MTTRIKLSKNLHEKMEFAISQYIQTLRESENDTNNILNIYKNSEINDIIVGLFKHSAYKCDESTLFN
jgi:RNase H-fold protein (predicted Holliday junction resolvase)